MRPDDDAVQGYASQAEGLAAMLGASVSAEDPDRQVIEPWAQTVTGRILDVGSGTGRWSGHLASLGHDIEGIEPVEQFLQISRSAHPGVSFTRAVVADLHGADQQWAGLLAWYSLIHLDPGQLAGALTTLRGALEPDGTMLLSFFTGPRLQRFNHPAAAAYRWPVEDMAQLLEAAGFDVVAGEADPADVHAWVISRLGPTDEHTPAH